MNLIRVTNIQRGCVYDGPGVRTTVFLKGCSLHCPWCCNPETISYEKEWYVNDEKCLLTKGIDSKLCENCERNQGDISIEKCHFGIVEPTSKDYTVHELAEILLRDKFIYDETRGGITFSGGEPLLQAEATIPLLQYLKEKKIHILYETTLVAPKENFLLVLPYIDCLIVDLKLQPQMMLNSEKYLKKIISMRSEWKREILYRMVFVNQISTHKEAVIKNLKELKICKLEVLLCHNLARKKYEKLCIKSIDFTSHKDEAESFCSFLNSFGIESILISI